MPDRQERPISFVTWTLTAAERDYNQIEKEGLAVVYAVTKLHNYMYGRLNLIINLSHP